jgi:hypothetical protein
MGVFMKYSVDIGSDDMIQHIPSLVKIGSGIQILLKVLPQQFERL